MSDRAHLVREGVAKRFSDDWSLLALRIAFGEGDPTQDIRQDLLDLYVFPERLVTSYRHEWLRILWKAVHRHAFSDHWRSDAENLERYFSYLEQEVVPRRIHDHSDLFVILGEVAALDQSDRVVRFPSRHRAAILGLIWPETHG